MSLGPPKANGIRARSGRDASTWLAFAAAPTFALMAALSTAGAPAMDMCSSMSAGLPVDSMVWMYLLMSLFHVSPWLRLASRWLRRLALAPSQVGNG
jgi:hypothetical protein